MLGVALRKEAASDLQYNEEIGLLISTESLKTTTFRELQMHQNPLKFIFWGVKNLEKFRGGSLACEIF